MKRTIVLAAVLVSSAALAAPGLDLSPSSEIFQYGDSMYTWDLETGGAVRVGAIWDGFAPAKEAELLQRGDFVYQRTATGEYVKVEAVWDGRVAAVEHATTLALKR